ncbi:mucin-2 isoform X1 [Tachysurus ichikawai]
MSSHFNTSCITQGPSPVHLRERKTRGVPTTPRALKTTTKPPPKSSTLATTKPTPKSSTLATTKPPPKSSTLATTKPPPKSSTLATTKFPPTASNFATTNPLTPKIMDSATPEPKINQSQEEMQPGSNFSATDYVMPPPPPPPKFNSSKIMSRKRREISGLWTLYGLFQLADGIACTSSPPKPTLNLCNLSCNKLIDNDLNDDISCVQSIINYKKDMLMNSCPTLDYTNYLAECKST